MNWLRSYHERLLQRIYDAPLYRGVDRLEMLWPMLAGGGVFAALDIGFGLTDPLRWGLLIALLGPGALWAGYVLFHEVRSLPARIRRHKAEP